MPLIIAADGVTVAFRPQPKTSKGKIKWREVKIALLTRLGQHRNQKGKTTTRLYQRLLVAVLGSINDLKPRLQLEAFGQNITTASQVVWISDGARGFWRLYHECFAHCAVGILDFYHATQHLWQAASAYTEMAILSELPNNGLSNCDIDYATVSAKALLKSSIG